MPINKKGTETPAKRIQPQKDSTNTRAYAIYTIA